MAFLILAALVVGWLAGRSPAGGSDPEPAGTLAPEETREQARLSRFDSMGGFAQALAAASVPPPLLAAERYVIEPGPQTLRELVASIGGLDAVVVGEAEGSFDLVRFDPLDPDRLLATVRSSYGDAGNQDTNERWLLGPGGLTRDLWSPQNEYDFVHFNRDGTITMWVPGGDLGFVPRQAVSLDRRGAVISTSQPVYASRFSSVGGTVFALTGDSEYYSNDPFYRELIADTGDRQVVLASGRSFGWIDNPSPDLLLAYPRRGDGVTAVWDAASLERLDGHPLAGRRYQRVAISGDGRVAVVVDTTGHLSEIDLLSGERLESFGSIDADGIDQPITLDHDGNVAVTVERSGLVTLWWVGVDEPLATVAGDAAQPRWLDERQAAMSASAVAADASRIALRIGARPQVPVSWTVLDTNPAAWIDQACRIAERALTPSERQALGLPASPVACP